MPGSAAAPALNGVALAGLACVGAAALAPRPLRYVLAGVLAVLGGAAVAAAVAPIADPLGAIERSVSTVTGVSGREPVAALVAGSAPTAWPGVAIAAGVALVVLGVAIGVTAARWPGTRRPYGAAGEQRSHADPWDDLSRGSDPTREPGEGTAPLDSEP